MTCRNCTAPAVEHGHCRGCLSLPRIRRALGLGEYVDPETGAGRRGPGRTRGRKPKSPPVRVIPIRPQDCPRGACPACFVAGQTRKATVVVGARVYCERCATEASIELARVGVV